MATLVQAVKGFWNGTPGSAESPMPADNSEDPSVEMPPPQSPALEVRQDGEVELVLTTSVGDAAPRTDSSSTPLSPARVTLLSEPAAAPPSVSTKEGKNLGEVCVDFCSESGENVAKLISYGCNIFLELTPDAPSEVHDVAQGARSFKNFYSVLKLPQKFVNLFETGSKAKEAFKNNEAEEVKFKSVLKVIRDCSSTINSMVDGVDLISQVSSVVSKTLKEVKLVNIGCIFIGSIAGLLDHGWSLANKLIACQLDRETALDAMEVTRNVAYLFFAGFVTAIACGVVISYLVVLGALSVALICTIAIFFHEKLCDPRLSGKSVPNAVVNQFKRDNASIYLRA